MSPTVTYLPAYNSHILYSHLVTYMETVTRLYRILVLLKSEVTIRTQRGLVLHHHNTIAICLNTVWLLVRLGGGGGNLSYSPPPFQKSCIRLWVVFSACSGDAVVFHLRYHESLSFPNVEMFRFTGPLPEMHVSINGVFSCIPEHILRGFYLLVSLKIRTDLPFRGP